MRPSGIARAIGSKTSGNCSHTAVSGVRTWPGATQLTRIVGPYSSAPLLVSAITPALAAEYAASLRVGVSPDTDALLTIAPPPGLEHERHRGAHPVERAGEVHVDEPVPELVVDGVQRPQVAGARVVEQHVDADRAPRRRRVTAAVTASPSRTSTVYALAADLLRRPAAAASPSRSKTATVAPSAAKRTRGRAPDTRRATGDDRDLSVELTHGRRR